MARNGICPISKLTNLALVFSGLAGCSSFSATIVKANDDAGTQNESPATGGVNAGGNSATSTVASIGGGSPSTTTAGTGGLVTVSSSGTATNAGSASIGGTSSPGPSAGTTGGNSGSGGANTALAGATSGGLGALTSGGSSAAGTVAATGGSTTGGASAAGGSTVSRMIATEIAAGQDHTCAIIKGGRVKCWGGNADGQLGNGTTNSSNVPVSVEGISEAYRIASAGHFSCIVTTSGVVYCWGKNDLGQLGNGTTESSTVPTLITSVWGVAAISASGSGSFICALTGNSNVYCWGNGAEGEMGNGASNAANPTPQLVTFKSSYPTSVSAGGTHACLTLADNSVQCWGQNSSLQLGTADIGRSNLPVSVAGITSAVSVAVGGVQSIAVLSDSTAQIWGQQVCGNGCYYRNLPSAISSTSSVTQVSAGSLHACLLSGGVAKCFGSNEYGQLGVGSTVWYAQPALVSGMPSLMEMSAAEVHSCALTTAGAVYCWGRNIAGQLGTGDTLDTLAPAIVAGF